MKVIILRTAGRLIFAAFIFAVCLLSSAVLCRAQNDALPLYRLRVAEQEKPGDLFSPVVKVRHFYTTVKAERDKSLKAGSIDEGIEGYIYKSTDSNCPKEMSPLIHLVRTSDGKHFYTQSDSEAKKAAGSLGYVRMETLGCVWTKQIAGTVPLYRLYHSAAVRDDHLYTTRESDKSSAMLNYDYKLEGVLGYVFPNPVKLGSNGYPNVGFPSAPKASAYAQKNRKNFETAAELMLGSSALSDNQISVWVETMQNAPYSFALDNDTATLAQINQFFKKMLAAPDGGEMRKLLVENVMQNVYSRPSTPTELAIYDSQIKNGKATFASTRIEETKKLVADSAQHRTVIARAFYSAFGKNPNADELQNWTSRQRGYGETIELMRQYLYSPAGAQALTEMLNLALRGQNGRPPSPDALKNAVQQYAAGRKIYSEIKK